MYPFLLTLWLFGLSEDNVLPPISDVDRFAYAADKASPRDAWVHQPERCQEHLVRLRHLRAVYGWSNGVWDDAITEMEFRKVCWETLEASQDHNSDFGKLHVQRMLGKYKKLVGAARYKEGWTPKPIPESSKFPRLFPRKSPVEVREGNANGNNED